MMQPDSNNMFSFRVRTLQNVVGSPRSVGSPTAFASPRAPTSPKTDVGEIDTRAPFQSVKAAVSLFGEVGTPRARPVTKKTKAEEQRLLATETRHHMVTKELEQYKEHLRTLENAKVQALHDLQIANRTVQDLTNKLEALSESKQLAITSTEEAKGRTRELEEKKLNKDQLGESSWKLDVDAERELYKASSSQLIGYKQELTTLRQDFDAVLAVKVAAFNKSEEARHSAKRNRETKKQLMEEVAKLSETHQHVKLASLQAEDEHLRLVAEKEVHFLVHKSAKEVAEQEIKRLEDEYHPHGNLQRKVEEATEAVKVLQEQLNDVRTVDLNSLQSLLTEVATAKTELQQALAEEASLHIHIESLKEQIQDVKQKISESTASALSSESKVEQLENDVCTKKADLDMVMSRNVVGEMQSNVDKLRSEAEKDKHEADKIMQRIRSLRQETEAAHITSKKADEMLEIGRKEAEVAKAAEKLADNKIYDSPRGNKASKVKDQGPARKIRLSIEEFKSMTQKIEDCRKEADAKIASLMAQLQSRTAAEKATLLKVEGMLKEKESIEKEMKEAVEKAEATAGEKAVAKGELRRLHVRSLSLS